MENLDYLRAGRASDLSDPRDRRIYRAWEILPGLLSWITIILIVAFSFIIPAFVAVFIIVFDIYWLIRTLYLLIHLRTSFKILRANMNVDWLEKLNQLPMANYQLPTLKSWMDIYHLVILPTYREGYAYVSTALESIANSNYPKNKFLIVLALEERAGKEFNQAIKEKATQAYGDKFFQLLITEHPANMEGEVAGKGSNEAWGGKQAVEQMVHRLEVPYERVIVSTFDIDTVVYKDFFSRVTYSYLTTPNPTHASYQPVPLYINNIWQASAFARVAAFGDTFWQIIQQERPEAATTFSSHSMSLMALADVGFWQTNMVSEDSRIFWQCFLHYNGDYRIEPIYYPVALDANVAPTFWKTMLNVYKQQRRWAYGVENIPYIVLGFSKRPIKFRQKMQKFWTSFEGYWAWSTNAIMLFVLGWLPILVGGNRFNQTILSYNLPNFTQIIMSVSTIGIALMAVLAIILLPPKPPHFGRFKYVWLVLQWLLAPISTILIGSFPSFDAQTRLMFGKYMGFWVTPKIRKEPRY